MGLFHVAAVDVYSRQIVGFSIMPRKNPITIYNTIFRPLLQSQGIWDQLRCDHGTEFCLISTIQHYLSGYRVNQQRLPVLQATSRQNHRVERIWPEVNSRVKYPIKAVLISMEEDDIINMRNNSHRFAVSWVGIQVVSSSFAVFVDAWNAHRIPGHRGGVPNTLAINTCSISALPPSVVPSTAEAVHIHESTGRLLSNEYTYGSDPLSGYPELQALQQRDFCARYPSMEAIFSDILHNSGVLLREAILAFIEMCISSSELIS